MTEATFPWMDVSDHPGLSGAALLQPGFDASFSNPKDRFWFTFQWNFTQLRSRRAPRNPEAKHREILSSYSSLCPCTSTQYSWVSNSDTCVAFWFIIYPRCLKLCNFKNNKQIYSVSMHSWKQHEEAQKLENDSLPQGAEEKQGREKV